MTEKETTLLKIDEAIRVTNIEINIGQITKTNEYYIRIGKAHYFNFGEALALLNDLEKHTQ